jgi:hypothetical protein
MTRVNQFEIMNEEISEKVKIKGESKKSKN